MELPLGDRADTLAKGDAALDRPRNTALEQQEVFVDTALPAEAAHGSDVLVGQILLGHAGASLGLRDGFAHLLDPLVVFAPVMLAVLACSGHAVHDAGWMPRSDTSHLPESLVSLSG